MVTESLVLQSKYDVEVRAMETCSSAPRHVQVCRSGRDINGLTTDQWNFASVNSARTTQVRTLIAQHRPLS